MTEFSRAAYLHQTGHQRDASKPGPGRSVGHGARTGQPFDATDRSATSTMAGADWIAVRLVQLRAS